MAWGRPPTGFLRQLRPGRLPLAVHPAVIPTERNVPSWGRRHLTPTGLYDHPQRPTHESLACITVNPKQTRPVPHCLERPGAEVGHPWRASNGNVPCFAGDPARFHLPSSERRPTVCANPWAGPGQGGDPARVADVNLLPFTEKTKPGPPIAIEIEAIPRQDGGRSGPPPEFLPPDVVGPFRDIFVPKAWGLFFPAPPAGCWPGMVWPTGPRSWLHARMAADGQLRTANEASRRASLFPGAGPGRLDGPGRPKLPFLWACSVPRLRLRARPCPGDLGARRPTRWPFLLRPRAVHNLLDFGHAPGRHVIIPLKLTRPSSPGLVTGQHLPGAGGRGGRSLREPGRKVGRDWFARPGPGNRP